MVGEPGNILVTPTTVKVFPPKELNRLPPKYYRRGALPPEKYRHAFVLPLPAKKYQL